MKGGWRAGAVLLQSPATTCGLKQWTITVNFCILGLSFVDDPRSFWLQGFWGLIRLD